MLLGGSRFLLPAIKAAHALGAYVITCDYLPDNYAHQFSDEYHNVSIVDKEAVLRLAQQLKIDGIMSYATNPGVVTAAYVAEKMGLPGNSPYKSVAILQNKGKFRKFLHDHGFNAPHMRIFHDWNDLKSKIKKLPYPVIVKPTDSAGSKGVTRVDRPEKMVSAFNYAIQYSISKEVIVEQFIEKSGNSTDTDSFSINGKLVYFSMNNQYFDLKAANSYTPSAFEWPSTMDPCMQEELYKEVQLLITLLHLGSSMYNIETRVGTDGKAYIMELSPRAGGNRLAEVLRLATGQDIIRASVQAALGFPIDDLHMPEYSGHWGLVVLHCDKERQFKCVDYDKCLSRKIAEEDLWVKPGDTVHAFTGANQSIGTLVLHCQSHDQLASILRNYSQLVHVQIE